jgi:hypothetical protein
VPQCDQIRQGLELPQLRAPLDEIDAELVSERDGNRDQGQGIETEIVAERCVGIERACRRTLGVLENQRCDSHIDVHVTTILRRE